MSAEIQLDNPLAEVLDNQPWSLPEIEPTTLLVLWPDEAPEITDVTSAIAAALVEPPKVLGELPPQDEDVQWAVAIEIPGLAAPLLIWCEPAQPLTADEMDDHRALACRWVIGVQTVLESDDPISHYANVIRLVTAALPQTPALLDTNTLVWHPHARLASLYLDDEVEPPADDAWVIHAVQGSASSDGPRDVVWLHTHGLWRCGMPELEILEVPHAHADGAATLLNELAQRFTEEPAPPAGEPFEVGAGVRVVLQPWAELVRYLDPTCPGGMNAREGEENHAHRGVRVVVCDAEQRGSFRKVWTWPAGAVEAIETGSTIFYRSERSTRRQEQLAKRTWPAVVRAMQQAQRASSTKSVDARFFLKVGLRDRPDDEPGPREHLWVDAERVDGEEIVGVLLDSPRTVRSVSGGDEVTVCRDQVTDWLIHVQDRRFGPEESEAMLEHFSPATLLARAGERRS